MSESINSDRRHRRVLPSRRAGYNQKLKIGGQTIYLRTGEYADGSLGEIFIDASKYGTVIRNLLNALAMTVSLGLQHGVPLQSYVDMFKGFWFPPMGEVQGDPRMSEATSILDAVFRELEMTYILGHDPVAQAVTEPEFTEVG